MILPAIGALSLGLFFPSLLPFFGPVSVGWLFIALIAMVVLSLAGVALIRAVDTSGSAAGNIAFREASVTAVNLAVEQAVNWQAGQHCPDRVAASVIAHDDAAGRIARRGDVGNPLRSQSRAGNQWVNRRVK